MIGLVFTKYAFGKTITKINRFSINNTDFPRFILDVNRFILQLQLLNLQTQSQLSRHETTTIKFQFPSFHMYICQTTPRFDGKTYQSYSHSRNVYACRMHIHKTIKECSTTDIEDYGCMCTNKDAISTFIQCYAYFQKILLKPLIFCQIL